MTGRKYLQNIENSDERMTTNYSENALKGFYILLAVFCIDNIYCRIIENYYGNPDYFMLHMRGGIAITFSLLFVIAELLISLYILKNAKNIKLVITLVNGILHSVKGLTSLLTLFSLYVIIVSILSILYDIYEIVFVHLLGVENVLLNLLGGAL